MTKKNIHPQSIRTRKPAGQLKQGDIIETTFGVEEECRQGERTMVGRRPCIVVSSKYHFLQTNMLILVPITRGNQCPKGNVPIRSHPKVKGFAKVHQLKPVDVVRRKYTYLGSISPEELEEIYKISNSYLARDLDQGK